MTSELLGLYIFGSVARGQRDAQSDLDLLAVVEDGRGKVPETAVIDLVPTELRGMEASISWYGRNRLGCMFREGELFAWHLHAETVPLFEREAVIAALGRPAPYTSGAADVASFEKILSGIPGQLVHAPENAVYELGLIYVCLRNICMAASWTLCAKPDFSRYSPFTLSDFPPAPIKPVEYGLAMTCRMAGRRGGSPAPIAPSLVLDLHARVAPWIAALRSRLEKR